MFDFSTVKGWVLYILYLIVCLSAAPAGAMLVIYLNHGHL